jgi:hypothetical protein
VRAFCAAHEEQSLYWWRREMAARDRKAVSSAEPNPPAGFVPVHVRVEPVAVLNVSSTNLVSPALALFPRSFFFAAQAVQDSH